MGLQAGFGDYFPSTSAAIEGTDLHGVVSHSGWLVKITGPCGEVHIMPVTSAGYLASWLLNKQKQWATKSNLAKELRNWSA